MNDLNKLKDNPIYKNSTNDLYLIEKESITIITDDENNNEEKNNINISKRNNLKIMPYVNNYKNLINRKNTFYSESLCNMEKSKTHHNNNDNIDNRNTDEDLMLLKKFERTNFFSESNDSNIESFEKCLNNNKRNELINLKCTNQIMNDDNIVLNNRDSKKQEIFQNFNSIENIKDSDNFIYLNNFKFKKGNEIVANENVQSNFKNKVELNVENSKESGTENVSENDTVKDVSFNFQNLNNNYFNYKNKKLSNDCYLKIKFNQISDFNIENEYQNANNFNIKYKKIFNSMIDSILSYPHMYFYESNYINEKYEKNYIYNKKINKSEQINNIPFSTFPISKDKTIFHIHNNNSIGKNNKNIFKCNIDNSKNFILSNYNREISNIYSCSDNLNHLSNNNTTDYSSFSSNNLQHKLRSINNVSNFHMNNLFKSNNKKNNLNYDEKKFVQALIYYNNMINKSHMNNLKSDLNEVLYDNSSSRNELFFNENDFNYTNNLLNNEKYKMQDACSNYFNNNYTFNLYNDSTYGKYLSKCKDEAYVTSTCINNFGKSNDNGNITFNSNSTIFKTSDNYSIINNKNNKCDDNIKSMDEITYNYYKSIYNSNSKKKKSYKNEQNKSFDIKKIKNRIKELQHKIKGDLSELSNKNINEKKNLNNHNKLKGTFKNKTRKGSVNNCVLNKNMESFHNKKNRNYLNYINETDNKIYVNTINENIFIKYISKQIYNSFNNCISFLCLSANDDKEIFEDLFFTYSKLFDMEINNNINIRNMESEKDNHYFYFIHTLNKKNNYKIIKKEKMYFYYKLKELVKHQYKMNILYEFIKNLNTNEIKNNDKKQIETQIINSNNNNNNNEEFDICTQTDFKNCQVLYENYLEYLKKFYLDDIYYEKLCLRDMRHMIFNKDKWSYNLLNSYSEKLNDVINICYTDMNKFENITNKKEENYNNNNNNNGNNNNYNVKNTILNEYNSSIEYNNGLNNKREIDVYKDIGIIRKTGTEIKNEKSNLYKGINSKNEMSKRQCTKVKYINMINANVENEREILIRNELKEFFRFKKKFKKILSKKENIIDNSKKVCIYKIRKIMRNLCKLSNIKYKTFLIHELYRVFFKFTKDKKKKNQNKMENLERKPLKIILNSKISKIKNEKVKDHFNSDESFISLAKKEKEKKQDIIEVNRKKLKKEAEEQREKKKQKIERKEPKEEKELEKNKYEKDEENSNYTEEKKQSKNRVIEIGKNKYSPDNIRNQNLNKKKRHMIYDTEYIEGIGKLDEIKENIITYNKKNRRNPVELNKLEETNYETSEKRKKYNSSIENKEIYVYIRGNLDVYLNENMNVKFDKCNIFFKKKHINNDFKMNFDKNFCHIFFNKILVNCIKDIQLKKIYFSSLHNDISDSKSNNPSDCEEENKILTKDSCIYKVNSLKQDEIMLLFKILYRNFYKYMPKLTFNSNLGIHYYFPMFSKNENLFNIKKSIIYEKLDDTFYFNFFLSKYINLKEGELYNPKIFFCFDRELILSIILYLNKNLGNLSILHKLYEEHEYLEYLKNNYFYNKYCDNEIVNHEDRYFNIIKNYLNKVIIPYCDHSNF
ncbi:conserved Plasmodium protein, unknown function [Plasmodium relictum]|uniref:Uncharacterized protein n=1 Tax=Plasmodium relictum TaxID=85471 RepID=A0A1J1H1I5_PLARL|nr:conserved Plasmodium protein, unknown function [Plasmodium relictum]CRG98707.1 conserved Plasmodium protein, unknown function [Plasmodium relictum]